MPIDYIRYPANWHEISLEIRTVRASGRCEWCGAENHKPHPVTGSKVVLTVAHLGVPRADGTPGDKDDKHDVRPENLAALCQLCHLNYDRHDHIQNRQRNRMLCQVRAGQLKLDID